MVVPAKEILEAALTQYVDAAGASAGYVEECVASAVAFIESRIPSTFVDGVPTSPLGDLYEREVVELGSELFYRKMARNGVVTVGADGNPMRISADPYRAAESRLVRFMPLGFG